MGREPASIEAESAAGRFAGVETALRRDALTRAIWSAGGLARAIATRVWETFVVGTLTATTSITTVDLTVTGTATLPGGSGGVIYTVSGSVQSLTANGQTITIPADTTVVRVSATGAHTGILIDDGTTNGQLLVIALSGTNNITLDGANFMTGGSRTIFFNESSSYIWIAADGLWWGEAEL